MPAASTRQESPALSPLLLLHGFLSTRGTVGLLERRLAQLGHQVLTYRMGLLHAGDIRDSAALVARKVESLAAQTSVGRIDIIGHSMGGLVGLYYIKRLGGHRRVRRLIMLGAPTSGTWSAILGLATTPLGPASWQLLPDSAFLRELEQGTLPSDVEVVTVAGQHDLLAPGRSTHVSGARQVTLPTSHAGLLVDAKVADAIAEILADPPERPESAACRR